MEALGGIWTENSVTGTDETALEGLPGLAEWER
jgi:hypothetical protein